MERHFTVTGYVVHNGRTLLHWHRKLQMWLPPGGHIEPDEDEIQTVLREVEEETGLVVRIIPQPLPVGGFDAPGQLPPPVAVLVEDIDEPGRSHQHIDHIYFTTPVDAAAADAIDLCFWRWVTPAELRARAVDGESNAHIAEDVAQLGLLAIERLVQATVAH